MPEVDQSECHCDFCDRAFAPNAEHAAPYFCGRASCKRKAESAGMLDRDGRARFKRSDDLPALPEYRYFDRKRVHIENQLLAAIRARDYSTAGSMAVAYASLLKEIKRLHGETQHALLKRWARYTRDFVLDELRDVKAIDSRAKEIVLGIGRLHPDYF